MARTVSEDICVNVTSTTKPADDAAEQGYAEETSSTDPALYYPIVLRNMQTEVQGLLPSNVQLLAVRSRSYCVAGDFRDPTVPIAELEADFRILFPLVSILTLNNQPVIDPIEHTVNDQSRIYGI